MWHRYSGWTLTSKASSWRQGNESQTRQQTLAFRFQWLYGRPDTIRPFPEARHPFGEVFLFSSVTLRFRETGLRAQKSQRK